jgi:hypothetical protein
MIDYMKVLRIPSFDINNDSKQVFISHFNMKEPIFWIGEGFRIASIDTEFDFFYLSRSKGNMGFCCDNCSTRKFLNDIPQCRLGFRLVEIVYVISSSIFEKDLLKHS